MSPVPTESGGRSRRHVAARLLILGLLLGVAGWAYAGFWQNDSQLGFLGKRILLLCRYCLPLVAVPILCAVIFGRPALRIRLLGSVVVALLLMVLLFPILSVLYDIRDAKKPRQDYHPYLQLVPTPFEHRATAAADPVRIFCLGGSTTEFRDSNNVGWPARVAQRIAQEPGVPAVEVHNLGRQWYSSLHSLINLEANLLQHDPDIIIVMHAVNDLLQNADFSYFSTGPFREDYGHFPGPVSRMLTRRSLYDVLRAETRGLWYHREREVVDTASFPGLPVFRRHLEAIITLAQKHDVAVVLMTQPHLFRPEQTAAESAVLYMLNTEAIGPHRKWSPRTARVGMEAYNAETRRIAAENGLTLIDLAGIVPQDLAHFSDDVHYTAQGFDVVGTSVAEALIPLLQAWSAAHTNRE